MKALSGFILVILTLFLMEPDARSISRTKHMDIKQITKPSDSLEIHFKDTLQDHFLYIYTNNSSIPIAYSRKIMTGVCIDGECRLVRIELFWSYSGNYEGFRLSKGELLSKAEHQPFGTSDYDQLHDLLGENNSPLANYRLDELAKHQDTLPDDIDGISSATLQSVLDHSVQGAVYTTYTLWHMIYGTTRDEVRRVSTENLSAEVVKHILQSDQTKEKIWVLNHLPSEMNYSDELCIELLDLVRGSDMYLAERALNAMPGRILTRDIQLSLSDLYPNSRIIKQRWIIFKLRDAAALEKELVDILLQGLEVSRVSIVRATLSLLVQHKEFSPGVYEQILPLLDHPSRTISDLALNYLEQLKDPDPKCSSEIQKYKSKKS